MTRITQTFAKLDRPALVTFITAGDPDYAQSLAILKILPDAGADIIELGMPFTDPAADGPTVEAASQRALKSGASMKKTLQIVREFRTQNTYTPIVLMGYYNPVLQYGLEKFAKDASTAGIDGLIIVDLPPEESSDLLTSITDSSIDFIRLITPTSDEKRLPALLSGASGFLYYVSITGVTGTAKADTTKVAAHIQTIHGQTDLPIAVGFGIKTPEDAAHMAKTTKAQAIVVGSAIVQTIADNQGNPDLPNLIHKQVSALSTALKS
jgi:tryptophan synthase alpha chain